VITWRVVPYGPPAFAALADAVAEAKRDDPLAPVQVVVPTNAAGVQARRWLGTHGVGGRPGVAGIGVLTLYRLAELLGAPALAAAGRRPVSDSVVAAAYRAVLPTDAGHFAPVAGHAGTVPALVEAHRLLRRLAGDDPDDARAALAAVATTGLTARETVRLHRAAWARLAPAWFDEADLLRAAITAANDPAVALRAVPGAVVVWCPQEAAPGAVGLLGALAAHRPVTVVLGRCGRTPGGAPDRDPGRDTGGHQGADDPDAAVVAALARLDPPTGGPAPAWSLPPWSEVSVTDADEEAREVTRAVLAATREGVPFARIAVLLPTEVPYARLVAEHLGAAGIPAHVIGTRRPDERLAGRFCLGLLDVHRRGWRRRELFALLAGTPLRVEGRPAPVTIWERLARDAGIGAGATEYAARVAHHIDQRVARARGRDDADAPAPDAPAPDAPAPDAPAPDAPAPDAPAPDVPAPDVPAPDVSGTPATSDAPRGPDAPGGPESPGGPAAADALRDRLERDARPFLGFVHSVHDTLAGSRPTWDALAAAVRRLLHTHLGDDDGRAGWPAAERVAARRVEAVLDRLAALAAVEPTCDLDTFTDALAAELADDTGREGRLGTGVLVAPLSAAVGLDADVVVVVGLAEGVAPHPVRDDALLPDRSRAVTGGRLPLAADGPARSTRWFLAALAAVAPHGRAVLVRPRGDLRASTARLPSRWLVALGEPTVPTTAWPSAMARLATIVDPVSAHEHRLAVVARDPADGPRRLAAVDAALARSRALVAARAEPRLTPYDGDVSGLLADLDATDPPAAGAVRDRLVHAHRSPTALGAFAANPFDTFVRQVLGVRPIEDPEAGLTLSALDAGNLLHAVFETFLQRRIDTGRVPTPDAAWDDEARRELLGDFATIADGFAAAGSTGHPRLWRRRRRALQAATLAWLDSDSERRRSLRATPVACELGYAGTYRLPDGRGLPLRGFVDRVDRTDSGGLVVVDYKTGRSDEFRTLSAASPVDGGRQLQLCVYGVAARDRLGPPGAAVRSEYRFVGPRSADPIGYPLDDDVLAVFDATLTVLFDTISAGLFPMVPPEQDLPSQVRRPSVVDPDRLGAARWRRRWERTRHDPRLAAFLARSGPGGAGVRDRPPAD
jgi:ATP-dependent helicase/nuclease subunit B